MFQLKWLILFYYITIDTGLLLSSKMSALDSTKSSSGEKSSSSSGGSKIQYSTTLVVLLVELSKLFGATIFLFTGLCTGTGNNSGPAKAAGRSLKSPVDDENDIDSPHNGERNSSPFGQTTWTNYLRYAFPSFFYAVSNNLNLIAIAYCGVALFSLFNSSKIVFSAVINWMLLGQKFHKFQKIGLGLLTFALVISRLESLTKKEGNTASTTEADAQSAAAKATENFQIVLLKENLKMAKVWKPHQKCFNLIQKRCFGS